MGVYNSIVLYYHLLPFFSSRPCTPFSLGYKYMISWNDCFENYRYWKIPAYRRSTSSTVVSGYCLNPCFFVIACWCCTTSCAPA
ncbi:hypothetical protein MKX03_006395 [Papaver bracteatum]|nr:hypothetical protein MKX03_006395 [Papaver bracteatum]